MSNTTPTEHTALTVANSYDAAIISVVHAYKSLDALSDDDNASEEVRHAADFAVLTMLETLVGFGLEMESPIVADALKRAA